MGLILSCVAIFSRLLSERAFVRGGAYVLSPLEELIWSVSGEDKHLGKLRGKLVAFSLNCFPATNTVCC